MINASYVVQASDADPYPNTATVTTSPVGFPNVISASDSESVNLFQPSFTIDKTGDTLSKVGDQVNYTITVTNTSSSDTPAMSFVLSDTLLTLAPADASFSLASGASKVINVSRTVQVGDPDPLLNTATAVATISGESFSANASDDHSTNLFQPSIAIDKVVDDHLAMVGDTLNYTITVTNTSSADSPNLVGNVVDAELGINQAVNMAPGAVVVINASYVVQASDADPYPNTATVTTGPVGFPNVISASDSESVNLFQPSFTIDKTGDDLSKVGDDVKYTITVTNTSSSDTPTMSFVLSDTLLTLAPADAAFSLASGASKVINLSRTVQAGDPDPLTNTATATATVSGEPTPPGAFDSHTTKLFQPSIAVNKEVTSSGISGDEAFYTVIIVNTGSADSPNLIPDSIIDTQTHGNGTQTSSPVPVSAFTETGGDGNTANGMEPGATWTAKYSYTLQDIDFPSLENVVVAHFHPLGFPNDITGSDGAGLQVTIQIHEDGRMTGGGSVFLPAGGTPTEDLRVTHGFQLHCPDLDPSPNSVGDVNDRLEVNWGKPNNHFHLRELFGSNALKRL